jgi:hypothetical protein
MQSSGLGAVDTASGVTAALDIGNGYVLNRSVALDRTRDTLHVGHIRVLVRLVEDVFLATNSSVVDIAVSRNGGSESEGGGDVLHRGNVRFDRVEERSERFVENTILRNECGIS